jgi:hypothetical protein
MQIRPPESKHKPSFHPLADIFPLMEGGDFEELLGDIRRRGFRPQFPIVIFEDQILDGRNRARAAEKAGVEPNYTEFVGTREDAKRFAIQANIHRRHLTPSQKRDLLKKLLKLNPEQSDRSLGSMIKVDKNTVAVERRKMEATGEIPQLKKRTGKDGKSRRQPAPKPMPASTPKLAAVPKPAIEQIREIIAPDEELELLREFARFVIEREGKCNFRPEDRPQWLILRERIQATLRVSPAPSHREFIATANGAAATANTGRMTAQREIPE